MSENRKRQLANEIVDSLIWNPKSPIHVGAILGGIEYSLKNFIRNSGLVDPPFWKRWEEYEQWTAEGHDLIEILWLWVYHSIKEER